MEPWVTLGNLGVRQNKLELPIDHGQTDNRTCRVFRKEKQK